MSYSEPLRFAATEWFGDGRVFRFGGGTELSLSAFLSLPVGASLVFGHNMSNHVFNLVSWTYPLWTLGSLLMISGLLTAAGIGLFTFKGRCIGSRIFRLLGSASGGILWMFLAFASLGAYGWSDPITYLYILPTVLYARSCSLVWRRFVR